MLCIFYVAKYKKRCGEINDRVISSFINLEGMFLISKLYKTMNFFGSCEY